jgi:hypothetical protein
MRACGLVKHRRDDARLENLLDVPDNLDKLDCFVGVGKDRLAARYPVVHPPGAGL